MQKKERKLKQNNMTGHEQPLNWARADGEQKEGSKRRKKTRPSEQRQREREREVKGQSWKEMER